MFLNLIVKAKQAIISTMIMKAHVEVYWRVLLVYQHLAKILNITMRLLLD